MSDLLKKYYEIMDDYKSGKYGEDDLYLDEVLEAAGEPDLFDRMSIDDIKTLRDSASGFAKMAFTEALKAKGFNG